MSIHDLEAYLETTPEEVAEVEKAFEEAAPLKEEKKAVKKPTPKKAKKR